jgi:hypothetical protein
LILAGLPNMGEYVTGWDSDLLMDFILA